jgi:hypothetical protein
MRKPRLPIDTPEKVTAAREWLGLDKPELARALRLAPVNGRNTVHRLEQDGAAIPGPTQLALEYLIEKASIARRIERAKREITVP